MSNYYVQTVINPPIPPSVCSPLELFLLKQIFDWRKVPEDPRDGLFFFAEESPRSAFVIQQSMADLDAEPDDPDGDPPAFFQTIIDASRALCPELCAAIEKEWSAGHDPDGADVDFDNTAWGYEDILQGIVKRAGDQLPYVTIEQSFSCSKMLADEFGGAASLILPDKVLTMSTSKWLDEQLKELAVPAVPDARTLKERKRHDD